MFYSQFILAKKGPLGTIWIAAHLERKLRKNQVAETDIGVTVDSILFPEVPIALRLSGHLLLGVVRIYSRQVNYLFNDCSETLGKIKQAFHSAAVDLPPEATTAPFHTITLPETFDFDELELVPDSESSYLHRNGNYVDPHVTTREQITLQDSVDHNPYLGSSQFGLDERFDDGSYFPFGLDFDEEFLAKKACIASGAGTSTPLLKEDTTEAPNGMEGIMPKKNVVVHSVGCENEVTPMDIDDNCQSVQSGGHEIDPLRERASTAPQDRLERDSHSNMDTPDISINTLNEHVNTQVSLRKGLDFAYLKHGGSVFNAYIPRALEACTPDLNQHGGSVFNAYTPRALEAYTPRALEACTPDLNQEYCPPDEPSTPALVDETSLPMYKELTVETAGRFSPVFVGHSERTAASETLPGSLQAHQVNLLVSSNEAIRSPNGALFQGLTLNQSAPVEEANRGCSTPIDDAQVPPLKEMVASMSSAYPSFPSFPQTSLQQRGVSLGGANFLANASNSLLTSSTASLPQFFDNSTSFVTNQWGHPSDHVISSPNQPQVGHYSPKTSFGVGTEPSGFGLPGMMNTMVGQVSTALIASPTSMNLSPSASSVSCSPMQNVEPSGFGLPGMMNTMVGGQVSTASTASPTSMKLSPSASSVSCLPMQNVEPSGFGQPGMMNTMVGQVSTASTASPTSMKLSPLASSVSCLPMQNVEPSGFGPPGMMNTMVGQVSTASTASPTSMKLSPLASSVSCLPMQNVEPSGFGLPDMMNTMVGQVPTASTTSPTSMNLSPLASSLSCLPMQNVLPAGQTHVDKNLAVTQGQLWQSAGQQVNSSSFPVMGPLMPPRGMEECETLRSAYTLQSSSPNFFSLQKDISDDRLPGLEPNAKKAFSSSIEGATNELLLPELDKTPILREETPFTAARASVLSTPSLGSEPGDDDVLASILGQRTKVFKVIPTLKAPKPPKVNVAPKRPKLVSRATPKRRKVDLDTVAVLHGDVIRQQLANTEDIRRERRKAPCTRREVWGFVRECEGQENFDEPALPELPPNLHELYHDVVNGRESRAPWLSGAPEVKEVSDVKLLMGAKGSGLSDCVKSDCMELEFAGGESDLLAHYVKKISAKDARPSQAAGSIENHSSEECTEQLISNEVVCSNQAVMNGESCSLEILLESSKEHRKEETVAQQNLSVGLMGTGNLNMSRAEELFIREVGTEVLAGKEGHKISFPEAQFSEPASSAAIRETGAEEQAVQAIEMGTEFEVVEQLQDISMVSTLSQGVLDSDVVNQGVEIVVQQDILNTEKERQPSSHFHEQDSHEGQPSQDANRQPVDIPSSGKDSTELPVLQAAAVVDNGNIEGGDSRLPTSVVSEEEVDVGRNDEEMATVEPERDTDCLDEENDAPYADIDYSSDEQDVSIQDDSGWSTRSRNVGKYLKTVFEEMQSSSKRLDQGANLGLERLLARRTRREAARMFFETLVLKTKDYIHVEQNVPYQDVVLYPKLKLMKTEF